MGTKKERYAYNQFLPPPQNGKIKKTKLPTFKTHSCFLESFASGRSDVFKLFFTLIATL
jgi:hypothetical protein